MDVNGNLIQSISNEAITFRLNINTLDNGGWLWRMFVVGEDMFLIIDILIFEQDKRM